MSLIKIFLIVIFSITICGSNYSEQPMGYAKDAYWFCKLVGHNKEDVKLLALSRVFMASPNTEYDEIEEDFEGEVYSQLEGNFISDFPARCMDFESKGLAQKHHKRQMHTAKRNGYNVIHISFP